jgi:hypothetical protein
MLAGRRGAEHVEPNVVDTVLRTLGGALGGQIAATFVAGHIVHGLPALTGFTQTFAMSALVLVGCVVTGLLVPARSLAVASLQPAATPKPADSQMQAGQEER